MVLPVHASQRILHFGIKGSTAKSSIWSARDEAGRNVNCGATVSVAGFNFRYSRLHGFNFLDKLICKSLPKHDCFDAIRIESSGICWSPDWHAGGHLQLDSYSTREYHANFLLLQA